MTKRDARGRDHVVRFTRPSGSVFAYCKRSKTGAGEGLGTRLPRKVIEGLGTRLAWDRNELYMHDDAIHHNNGGICSLIVQ